MLPRIFYDTMLNDEIRGMECDIYQKDGVYHVELDIPGFKKENIKIECHKGNLTVKAIKEEVNDDSNKKYIRHERKYNKLERSFYFGDIDEDNIKADFKNGTLHIEIPTQKELEKKEIIIE